MKNYCIGIFFTSFLSCLAQEDSTRVRYFKPFDDNITTKLSVNSTSNSFVLNDVANNMRYDIVPNDRERIDLGISYRSIAFSFGFAPDFLATNKDNNNSKLYNLNFRAFHKQWTQSFDLYSQRGFYLEANDQQVPLPEMKTLKIGGQTSYILNKNFSFRAVSAQSEWQQKSAGSFVPTLSLYYTKLRFKIEDFDETVNIYTAALSPAYYYNFVIRKNFFFSLGVLPGFGVEYADSDASALYQMEISAALGYNSDTFFAGINSNAKYFNSNTGSDVEWGDTVSRGEIYLGYRFKPPKKLTETTDKINQKLPFKK
ncbi:hypothetical protein FNO01nite_07680 [Flavobacterium noncentrifugens]|uniref:DUF4421 domain-containing protein n=1 Tax=Flavobacterium noncentrifugens TaxID=1128970 RepID=A0A1G8T598_9FLAO|nr:DUF4421 family protein [Flavobacterium noncentrifugens]GEP50096.1 hypothetical protein FNO01nite_07680 [Flavobacterium noncentrifugens]SDJ36722.1 protein of unknown function [Flavobacterium noncentrifugens]